MAMVNYGSDDVYGQLCEARTICSASDGTGSIA